MIFIGDIAVPGEVESCPAEFRRITDGELVVANLEGALLPNADTFALARETKLFNHTAVLSYLRQLNVGAVSLANNHVFDYGQDISYTTTRLSDAGIAYCGAGRSIVEAAAPLALDENGRERVFLAFGWHVIQCRPASETRPGVNPLDPHHVIQSVQRARREHPEAAITLLMHWNYELEVYPMPAHRQLAFLAIDHGANAVIGCHSHCVQGAEVYKGAPIVYGLGNWMVTQGVFFGGRLRFPDMASLELAFEWIPETRAMKCHWFEFDAADQSLRWRGSEALSEARTIRDLTPYAGMDGRDYVKWFRRNRRKRTLLPIYAEPEARIGNRLRDWWIARRQEMIRLALALGVKGGPR